MPCRAFRSPFRARGDLQPITKTKMTDGFKQPAGDATVPLAEVGPFLKPPSNRPSSETRREPWALRRVCRKARYRKEPAMLFTIAAILFVLWLLGLLVFKVSGALIHVLLVIAIIVGLVQLFRGRRM